MKLLFGLVLIFVTFGTFGTQSKADQTTDPNAPGYIGPIIKKCYIAMVSLGGIALLIGLLALPLSAFLSAVRRTVVLTGVPKVDGIAMLAALVIAVLTGIGMFGLSTEPIATKARKSFLMFFALVSVLIIPVFVTSAQLTECWTFAGKTAVSQQIYRIDEAIVYGKSPSYAVVIDPYYCQGCGAPGVAIDRATYKYISAKLARAAEISGHPGQTAGELANLCMTFTTERAGKAERIVLADRSPHTMGDIKPCPPGAR